MGADSTGGAQEWEGHLVCRRGLLALEAGVYVCMCVCKETPGLQGWRLGGQEGRQDPPQYHLLLRVPVSNSLSQGGDPSAGAGTGMGSSAWAAQAGLTETPPRQMGALLPFPT